jgi:hypothetical protein
VRQRISFGLLVCPNCHRLQPSGALECSACGVIFAKFRASPGRIKQLNLELPTQGPWTAAVGLGVAVFLVWAWFNPGLGLRPSAPLEPGGEPVPATVLPGEPPEQTLARHLRTVDAEAVEALQLMLEPIWLDEGRLGVDQVRVVAVLTTAGDTVSATGRLDYSWTRGDERPSTSHSNVQALSFRRGEVDGVGQDVVHKELIRIDAPRATYTGQTIRVAVTFEGRRSAEAELVLDP